MNNTAIRRRGTTCFRSGFASIAVSAACSFVLEWAGPNLRSSQAASPRTFAFPASGEGDCSGPVCPKSWVVLARSRAMLVGGRGC